MTHGMHLSQEGFAKIKNGQSKVEPRLNDEKRQRVFPGDEIIFTNKENEAEKITVKVVGISRFASFADLYATLGKLGGVNTPEEMRKYYPEAEEKKLGVVGIHFVK